MIFNQAHLDRLSDIIKERSSKIVFWIGSGLSIDSGLPSWEKLKGIVANKILSDAETFSDSPEKDTRIRKIISAKNNPNFWISFEIFKQISKSIYTSTIKSELGSTKNLTPSKVLQTLFKLPTDYSIVTLNIDNLALTEFIKNNNDPPDHFTGTKCKDYIHLLNSSRRFFLYAHGELDDVKSWIFTQTELRNLLDDNGYNTFIKTLFLTRTNVFIGLNARDIAIQKLLKPLSEIDALSNSLFWITDQNDIKTTEWAEKIGISVIRYNNRNNHQELTDIVNTIISYLPSDIIIQAPASFTNTPSIESIPSPELIMKQYENDIEGLRNILNQHAKYILSNNSIEDYKNYEKFKLDYKKAIYLSWYYDLTKEDDSYIMGYKLVERINEGGAFGEVFKAKDKNNDIVALKLIRNNIINNDKMIQSFRRGVRAMKILSKNKINGMVEFIESSEIPSFVVMEYINGCNLEEAYKRKLFNSWGKIINYSLQLSNIISKAHNLPEIILHRDIRPANIMIKDNALDECNKIVVLDFDLSWIKDSNEQSISNTNASSGYLAPEQIDNIDGVSTKNAAVDSFGLGMTLYYMISGEHPKYNDHQLPNWKFKVHQICLKMKCKEWLSIPYRFADLIINATKHNQNNRIDMNTICGELDNLYTIYKNPKNVESQDLITYEIGYRCCEKIGQTESFNWDYDKHKLHIDLPSGVDFVLSSDEIKHITNLNIGWKNKGHSDSKNIHKYLPSRIQQINQLFNKKSIRYDDMYSKNDVFFDVDFDRDVILNDIDVVIGQLTKIIGLLDFY